MRTTGDEILSTVDRQSTTEVTINHNHYVSVCDYLRNGRRSIGPAFALASEIRDARGFVIPTRTLYSQQMFVGFSDNHFRPGILCQKLVDIEFPKGHEDVKLPSGTRFRFAKGQYFVDAVVFNEMMKDQILTVTL